MPVYAGHRQTHHIEITPLDAVDEFGGQSLDCVGAGFVHRLAASDVRFDLSGIEVSHVDARGLAIHDHATAMPEADAGNHDMVPARKRDQHGARLGGIGRFFQNCVSHQHDRVRTQDDFVLTFPRSFCFGPRQPSRVYQWTFARPSHLVHGPRAHAKHKSCIAKQLAPARRLGSQNQIHDAHATIMSSSFKLPMERAGRLIRKLGLSPELADPEARVRATWPAAAGKKIAAHSRAGALVRSTLIVEVEDHVWQRQLSALRHFFLQNLARELGEALVTEIDFRPMPRRREPQRATAARSTDYEAEQIRDPVLAILYKRARRSAG
jgi:hypothetical protein